MSFMTTKLLLNQRLWKVIPIYLSLYLSNITHANGIPIYPNNDCWSALKQVKTEKELKKSAEATLHEFERAHRSELVLDTKINKQESNLQFLLKSQIINVELALALCNHVCKGYFQGVQRGCDQQ